MATRVLIIYRQLVAAVTLKQALEQTGQFEVHPFTQADAAFDYLREHPHDVALVDFQLPARSGSKLVQQLRAIQPELAIIITPRQPNMDSLMLTLNLQGVVDPPFSARTIIPAVRQALEYMNPAEPSGLTDVLGSPTSALTGSADPTHTFQPEADAWRISRQYGSTDRFTDQLNVSDVEEERRWAQHQKRPLKNRPARQNRCGHRHRRLARMNPSGDRPNLPLKTSRRGRPNRVGSRCRIMRAMNLSGHRQMLLRRLTSVG